MSIMPTPDALINSVLDNETDRKMHVYNLERKSSLKTHEKDEIVNSGENMTKNTEVYKSDETTDSSAVKEILDIFPGARVKK